MNNRRLAHRDSHTLIGYFPKRTMKRPDWLKASGVEEVCSVSTCVSNAPDGWIDQWRHNEMWAFDTPELALSVVPEAARGEFELYAYQMFPVQFDEGQQHPFEIPPLRVAPLLPSFVRLGFDVVSRSCGSSFECSPLSCNHMAEHVASAGTAWLTTQTWRFSWRQSLRLAVASLALTTSSKFGDKDMMFSSQAMQQVRPSRLPQ